MKSIIALSLLAFSMSSFAAVRMVATGECSSTVSQRIPAETQKAELTKCAESKAHRDLSTRCEGRGTGWLLESEIAKREYRTFNSAEGRSMSVSTMAVGRCEI